MLPKHKAKTGLLKILDKLPESMGYKGYHFFQKKLGKVNLDQQIDSSYSSYQTFLRLTEKLEIPVKDKRFLEIGSGWLPIMPYFFKFLSKAREVYTFDLNMHYESDKIKELNTRFSEEYRLEISEESDSQFSLPTGIHYFPKTDLNKIELPQVDVVFSRFVLEHVEPEAMKMMHEKFKQEFKKGTHIIHLISPSDHRAYADKSLSLQDFLRFSQGEWNKIQTKFDYHNRWRLPQYIDLFESLGYEIMHLEYHTPEKDSEAYRKFKEVPIHSDFLGYEDKDLMAGAINIVIKI